MDNEFIGDQVMTNRQINKSSINRLIGQIVVNQ